MEYKIKHQFNLSSIDVIDIDEEIIRMCWSVKNKDFSRNTFVTINVVGKKRKAYRLLRGASSERIDSDEVLISYNTYKYLNADRYSRLRIVPSSFWESNFLFYFKNPDPRKRHKLLRDFTVATAAFIVSIFELLEFFGFSL